MKKQILLIVMSLCAMSAMAVSLPRASYNAYSIPTVEEGYTLGIGTKIVNFSTVSAGYEGGCTNGSQTYGTVCFNCCVDDACAGIDKSNPTQMAECINSNLYLDCMSMCQYGEHLGEEGPLDIPAAFLLALIAAYGAFAVYRRKMQQV
jgi:hypothetical protein